MDKKKTIENMAKFYYEVYAFAINDTSVPIELQLELDMGALDFVVNDDLDAWISTLNFIDSVNNKVVDLANNKPETYEGCRILNRKLTMIIDGMKKVMQKDLHVCGWMRNNGRLEAVL